jgi:WD40 repeat protein
MCRTILTCLFLLYLPLNSRSADGPRTSQPGGEGQADPLPAGAVMRFGSVRWKHEDTVTALAFSRDGKFVATACADKKLRLWETGSGKLVREFDGHSAEIRAVGITPNGSKIISAGLDGTVRLWDLRSGKALDVISHEDGVECLAVSPDGKYLASGDRDWAIRLTRIDGDHAESMPFAKHQSTVTGLVFAQDSKSLISCGSDKNIYLWKVDSGEEVRQFSGHNDAILCLALSKDGKTLATGGKDGTVRTWDLAEGREKHKLAGDAGNIWGVAFSPDGKRLVSAGDGLKPEGSARSLRTVRMWDVENGKELKEPGGHGIRLWRDRERSNFSTAYQGATCAAFSPDGASVATAGIDGRVRFWDPATSQPLGADAGNASGMLAMAMTPSGKFLALATDDGKVRLFETRTGKEVRPLLSFENDVPALAFSPDGERLAVGGKDGIIHVLETSSGNEIATCKGHDAAITRLRFSPDGKAVLAAAANSTLRLWDAQTGKELAGGTLDDQILAIGFTPDGKKVLTGCDDCVVCSWNSQELKAGRPVVEQRYPVAALALSADGSTLATAGVNDKIARLWDFTNGSKVLEFVGHQDAVDDVLFAPRGQTVVTASRDGTVRLWERTSGKERGILRGHLGEVNRLALARDGSLLVSRSRDGTVLVWDALATTTEKLPAKLDHDALEKLWNDLGAEDATVAWQALITLSRANEQCVPFVKEHVKPVSKEISARIKKLIADLDSEDFEAREKATDELAAIGSLAADQLRAALKSATSLEFKVRAEKLLAKMEAPGVSPEQLRYVRAIESLELTGDKPAREYLKLLAGGMTEAAVTKVAKETLARLDAATQTEK